MRLYKCLNQTIDLEHVLAVSDLLENQWPYFMVTLMLRDTPIIFDLYKASDNLYAESTRNRLTSAREQLLKAWSDFVSSKESEKP